MKAPKRSCRYSFCGMGRFPPVLMGCDATIVVVLSHLTLRGVSRVVYCFVLAKSESNSVLIAAKGGIGKPQCQWSCRSVSTCCVCVCVKHCFCRYIYIYVCVKQIGRLLNQGLSKVPEITSVIICAWSLTIGPRSFLLQCSAVCIYP